MKISKNQKGFAAIELLIVILVIAIIGAVGWIVYKDHKTSSSTASSNTTNSTPGSITNKNATISYSGWKTYCEEINEGPPYDCIKYNPAWTLTETNDHFSSIFYIINASKTAAIQYNNLFPYATSIIYDVDTGNPLTEYQSGQSFNPPNSSVQISLTDQNSGAYNYQFLTESISSLASNNSSYEVVGGYYLGSKENIPSYVVLDTKTIKSYALEVGKISSPDGSLSIGSNDGYYIWGGPISLTTFSASQAKGWLNSTDGISVLDTLKTFEPASKK